MTTGRINQITVMFFFQRDFFVNTVMLKRVEQQSDCFKVFMLITSLNFPPSLKVLFWSIFV